MSAALASPNRIPGGIRAGRIGRKITLNELGQGDRTSNHWRFGVAQILLAGWLSILGSSAAWSLSDEGNLAARSESQTDSAIVGNRRIPISRKGNLTEAESILRNCSAACAQRSGESRHLSAPWTGTHIEREHGRSPTPARRCRIAAKFICHVRTNHSLSLAQGGFAARTGDFVSAETIFRTSLITEAKADGSAIGETRGEPQCTASANSTSRELAGLEGRLSNIYVLATGLPRSEQAARLCSIATGELHRRAVNEFQSRSLP